MILIAYEVQVDGQSLGKCVGKVLFRGSTNTTWKTTTRFTLYELVYGKKALLSIEFEYNTLRMESQLDLDLIHAQKEILFH